MKNASPYGACCTWIDSLSQGVLQDGKNEWVRVSGESSLMSSSLRLLVTEELPTNNTENMHRCANTKLHFRSKTKSCTTFLSWERCDFSNKPEGFVGKTVKASDSFSVSHILRARQLFILMLIQPPFSFQPLFPEIGTTLCTGRCCKHLPGGSARPLARQLQGSDVIWWRGCLVRRQEKGRVKNNLKTTNPALLGCRPKMDLSLKWTNHVSHLY